MATDFDYTFDDADFGDMTASEVMSSGTLLPPFSMEQVAKAESRVQMTGILDRLAAWRNEDIRQGVGGRPALVSDRAILVGLLLLASEHSPLWILNLADVFQNRLAPESRALLGLPAGPGPYPDHFREQKRWYNNTHNAFHRMVALMEPFPQSRRFALTYTQVKAILDAHDHNREVTMRARLNEFSNAFLHMTFMQQPRHIRRATKKIDISVDQTFIKPPSRKGFSRNYLDRKVAAEAAVEDKRTLIPGPVEVFAGMYPQKGNHPDFVPGSTASVSEADGKKKGYSDLVWGWMINIAVRVDSERPGESRFPKLAISATLSMPNVGVSEEAVELMRAALATGLEAGIVDADKAYFANAVIERLHKATFDLGFTPSTDYRVDRLGVQGGKAGAEFIEGKTYCPGMPQKLKDATKDLLANTIDEVVFHARRRERVYFEIRAKEKPDSKGRTPMMCPAIGKSPTVTCPLRELMLKRDATASRQPVDKARRRVADADVPSFADKICTQHSVSFAKEDGMRQRQALPYKSKEWEEVHKHARNSIESLNAGVKEQGRESIEESSRRKVRGFAAAQVFVTILLTNYNLRKIAVFLREEVRAAAGKIRGIVAPPAIIRRRDREWHNPYTKTYPSGVQPPGTATVDPPLTT